MASTIGLKVANGEFYPLIEENSAVKKRLILTTVHDSQRSVQIDLYKSLAKSMADAQYIGSLVVENISAKPKGEPSIEMIIASNREGEITADATDLDTSVNAEHHHLSVSLKSLDEDSRDYEIPDFELEQHEPPPQGLYERAQAIQNKREERRIPWAALIIIGALIILACLLLGYFLIYNRNTQDRPAAEPAVEAADTETPVITAPEPGPAASSPPPAEPGPPAAASGPPAAAPGPAAEAPPPASPARPTVPANRARPNPPVASYKVPTTIPPEGVTYRIRWGDTLWDISEAFYRNPRLYTRLARINSIRNPNLIISGTTIKIPPR